MTVSADVADVDIAFGVRLHIGPQPGCSALDSQVVSQMQRLRKLAGERSQVEVPLEPGASIRSRRHAPFRPHHPQRRGEVELLDRPGLAIAVDLPAEPVPSRREAYRPQAASRLATRSSTVASPSSEMRPCLREPSIAPLNSPRDSIKGLVSVHGQCAALSESCKSCSPLESISARLNCSDQVESLRLVGPVQVDVPDDRSVEPAEVDRHIGSLGDDRLGESRVAEAKASVRNANEQPLLGVLADHRLERFVEVDRAVGEPLDVQIALFEQQSRRRWAGRRGFARGSS